MGKNPILFVEDNSVIRGIFLKIMENMGLDHEIIEAETGSEGLKKLSELSTENRIPDLIITGIFMPGMHGLEFISEVFKIQDMRKVPVLFLDNCFYDMICQPLSTLENESEAQIVFLNVSSEMEGFCKIVFDLLSGGLSDEGKKIVEEEKKKEPPKTSMGTGTWRRHRPLGLDDLLKKII